MTKKKFKVRRKITREELFPKKILMDQIKSSQMKDDIEKAFPDKVERKKYIQSLIKAMEGVGDFVDE